MSARDSSPSGRLYRLKSTITRCPIRAWSTPSPTAATVPTMSAPWIRGKVSVERRSEERRVGKECRARKEGKHQKKNRKNTNRWSEATSNAQKEQSTEQVATA